jgi:ABC-type maltose transport system permease subunit
MNKMKKALGIVWMLLAPVSIIFLLLQAIEKVGLAAEGADKTNTALQWGIILFIFIPISAGLVIFGYYAMKGEYDHLPEDNDELTIP